MVTTKIEVKPHLKEYIIGKFNNCIDGPVQFPDKLDIYHHIWDLVEKRPVNASIDRGNLEIILPDRRIGKSPETYNYLGNKSVKWVENKIKLMMMAELHDFMEKNKHAFGINYNISVHHFMKKYAIRSISEDAYIKNHYRWRQRITENTPKRQYRKANI